MHSKLHSQKGAVSLFIVIFSALLISTITVAFVRIMIQDQQQATANDLSASALDSAQAGVEDAKRAIIEYGNNCDGASSIGGSTYGPLCGAIYDGTGCDTLQKAGIVGVPDPVDGGWLIKQSVGDHNEQLRQAYTCVKVNLHTSYYVASLAPNTSRLIHLKSDANTPFTSVKIEWYSHRDLQAAITNGGLDPSTTAKPYDGSLIPSPLPKDNITAWPAIRPALLRVQLIQHANPFSLSDFNDKSDNAALFLYPSSFGTTDLNFNDPSTLQNIKCLTDFSNSNATSQYACSATITLPNPFGGDANNRDAYLRVNEFYNTNTTFSVSLSDSSGSLVKFNGVQAVIDSTGRANDLFRRVQSIVDLGGSSIPNVEAATDITGGICKVFLVTDDAREYNANIGLCTP